MASILATDPQLPNFPNDSSSSTGSTLTSSTVWGPGALTGKFLKAVGERGLDFVVNIVIRRRLASIRQTLDKNPRVLRNPTTEEEWRQMNETYADLEELSLEDYSVSLQRAAAKLVAEITLITRPGLNVPPSATNSQWEELMTSQRCSLDDIIQSPDATTDQSVTSHSDWVSSLSQPSGPSDALDYTFHREADFYASAAPSYPLDHEGVSISGKANSTGPYNLGSEYLDQKAPAIADRRLFRSPWRTGIPRLLSRNSNSAQARTAGSRAIQFDSSVSYEQGPKILLLGASGVGKTTLVKQLQSYENPKWCETANSFGAFHANIIENTIFSMKDVLLRVTGSDFPYEIRERMIEHIRVVNEFPPLHDWPGVVPEPEALQNVRLSINSLWDVPTVRRWIRYHGSHRDLSYPDTPESAEYFLDSADRILAPDYEPTLHDIMRSCRCTTIPSLYGLNAPSTPCRALVDMGGVVSQRYRWVRHFTAEVPAIICVVALSDYNKVLFENKAMNRMDDSLNIFSTIANSRRTRKTLIVLLFNKLDVLRKQLEEFPLKDWGTDYGGGTCDDALKYIENRFLKLLRDKGRPVVTYCLSALDGPTVAVLFEAIGRDIIRHEQQRGVIKGLRKSF